MIINLRVKECALQLQDEILLAKLSAGDLISQEAIYHGKCLASLYNKARKFHKKEGSGYRNITQAIDCNSTIS